MTHLPVGSPATCEAAPEAASTTQQADLEKVHGHFWSKRDLERYKAWLFHEKYASLIAFTLSRLSYSNEQSDAEDAWMQFTVDRLDQVLRDYDPTKGRSLYSWLLYKLAFYCRDLNRSSETRNRATQTLDEVRIEVLSIDDPRRANHARDLLQAAMSLLSRQNQHLFASRYLEGRSYQELATEFDIPLGTVRSRLFSLRKRLKQHVYSLTISWEEENQ
ncbi:MAG: sigma-70 family RNA polymerase sigma factor [bacterium]|nr:sigma-70 family RNA polymerase sigma factor [bacterium]